MPESFFKKLKERGGVKRWRTIIFPNGEYAHVAVVSKRGKRGGHTIIGEIRERIKA